LRTTLDKMIGLLLSEGSTTKAKEAGNFAFCITDVVTQPRRYSEVVPTTREQGSRVLCPLVWYTCKGQGVPGRRLLFGV